MIDSAQDYLNEEFSVIPLRADKSPMLPAGHPFLYERMSVDDVDRYFIKAQKIGIACGNVSNGLEVMDFDGHQGENIREVFNTFMKDVGVSTIVENYNLPIVKTMNGGYHLYYKTSIIEGSRKLAQWEDNTTMIETRGEGSYVATVPSEGYELIHGCELIVMPEIDVEERDYLIMIAERMTRGTIKSTAKQQSSSQQWPTKYDQKTAWGAFNENGINEAKELLESVGWKYIRTRKHDNVEMWQRPNKEQHKNGSEPISATFGMYHNMFYVFSSNAAPFQERTAYTLFDILMILKFKGNKQDTIKYLEHKYNIQHYKPIVQNKQSIRLDFPIGVFPELIQNYIEEQNKISNFDINLMCSTFVWLASTLIGNKFTTYVNDNWNVSPVMWLMIIAERGSTKTHAINAIIKAAKKLDNESRRVFEQQMKEYDLEDKTSKKPRWKQLFLEDGTREGYIKAITVNPKGLGLMKDELTGWVADMDRHSSSKGGDEAFWLSSFNNTSYTKNIKGDDGTHVERMFINLAGSIQPQVINDMVKNHSANGLFDRFLLVPYVENQFTFTFKKPELSYYDDYTEFIRFFNDVISRVNDDSIAFMFDDDAEVEFEAAYNGFLQMKYNDPNPSVCAYIAKIITYLPRISLVIEIVDQMDYMYKSGELNINAMISKNSVVKANDILKYFLNNAKNVLFDIDEKTDMNDIIRAAGAIKKVDKAKALLYAMLSGELQCTQNDIAQFLSMNKSKVSAIKKQLPLE